MSLARSQLEDVILPFWLTHGPDERSGGFFTCFDNRGRRLVSTDKFTWSQGRFVWLLARAARLAAGGLLDADADRLVALAERGARFLLNHAVRADGTCHFVLTADGGATAGPNGETQSVYADCFVVMGLAELARTTSSPAWLAAAQPLLSRATTDIRADRAHTPPYAVPAGFRAFGPRMILLNTRLEYARACQSLGLLDAEVRADLTADLTAMLAHRAPDGTFVEMRPDSPDHDSLVARHRVPGHALEGIWVALETGALLGDHAFVPPLLSSVEALCESAWDASYGGLLRYVDEEGGQPRGTGSGTPYESLVRSTWSTKLWWVHTEAAYTTALAARRYGAAAAAYWHDTIWQYTLATFPGRADGEEWVQIRNRQGQPLEQVVALPVKDPFHIARNLMQLVELDADHS